MGKIVISTNVALDGVVQDPDGQAQPAVGPGRGRMAPLSSHWPHPTQVAPSGTA
jgi:hypothetical protein